MYLGAALLIGGGPLSLAGCSSSSLTAGKLYLKQQQYELAMEQLELAVAEDSTDAAAYYHLGRAYGLAGYHTDMVVAFDRSLLLSSKFAQQIREERLHYWSRSYNDGVRIASMSEPDLARALSKFELATQIVPERLQAWRNLGLTQFTAGDVDAAIATFQHVTDVSRLDTTGLRVLGTLLLRQGRAGEAVTILTRALNIEEQQATLTNLAVAHTQLGDLAAAEEVYLRALKADPDHWQCFYNLGSLYWQQGRPEDALAAFHRAVELNPADADARYNLGVVHLTMKQFSDALPLLQRLTEEMPHEYLYWDGLARVYDGLEMPDQSRKAQQQAESLSE